MRHAIPIVEQALKEANLPCLLVAVAQLTGNADHLTDELKGAPQAFSDPNLGGLDEAQQDRVRSIARKVITDYLQSGRQAAAPLAGPALWKMISFLLGPVPVEYEPYVLEALALDNLEAGKPSLGASPLRDRVSAMKVVIIGAGASGLLMAIRLQEAGVPFEIIEKNPDLGGTWFENIYPGCRVDTENHTYCYSFEPNPTWPQHYSTQPELLGYFQKIAQKYRLRDHIRFDTKAVEARFNEASGHWTVVVKRPDGALEERQATAVVSAVGQLNQPKFPDIPGRETFAGVSFHTARWRRDVDLTGKRVAVIGTGASAFQVIPEVAKQAAQLFVFQRSPTYLIPTADYHEDVGAGQQWLLRNLPFYDRWYRLWLFWIVGSDGAYALIKRDPAWTRTDSVNEGSFAVRSLLLDHLRRQIGEDPLYDHLAPDVPVWSKRVLRDDGLWVETLKRDNVELVTSGIDAITPTGLIDREGVRRDVDVIVYGTGFHADAFLRGVRVTGRQGTELHAFWRGDPRAYLGMTAPGFPNFFMLYGPNTNIVVNISILFFTECAANYIVKCLELLADRDAATLELKKGVFDRYCAAVDETGATLAWCAPGASSWYKNAKGLSAQNWPFRQIDYWSATRAPDPSHYEFAARPSREGTEHELNFTDR